MSLYTILTNIEKLTVSEPFGGITTATYRYSLDYIPATQIYGLILKSMIINELQPGTNKDYGNTLNIINYIERYGGKIRETNPMLIYDQEFSNKIFSIFTQYLAEIDKELYNVLKQPTILSGLVETPRHIKKTYSLECNYLPLGLLPFLGLLHIDNSIIDKLNSICSSYSISIARRFRAGIVIDRVRKSSLSGLFYAYQYTIPSVKNYITTLSIEYGLERIKDIIRILGTGYKKNLNRTFKEIMINKIPLSKYITVNDILRNLAKELTKYIISKHKGKIDILVYAYDNTLFPMPTRDNKLLFIWINGYPKIYLEATNKFYIIEPIEVNNLRLHLCKRGSYALIEYDCTSSCNLLGKIEDLTNIYKYLDKNKIRIIKVLNSKKQELNTIEKELVFNKLVKSMINYVIIPIPKGVV